MIQPNRLFFALLPDAEARAGIAKAARELAIMLPHQGKPVPEESYHLTLLFLGDAVPASEERSARAAAASVACAPITFNLDAGSSFPGSSPVWWLGPQRTPESLLGLRKALQAEITAHKVAYDRQRFVPHVTVVRNARARLPQTQIKPIGWACDSFALMRSSLGPQGSRYEIVERWLLRTTVPEKAGQIPLL